MAGCSVRCCRRFFLMMRADAGTERGHEKRQHQAQAQTELFYLLLPSSHSEILSAEIQPKTDAGIFFYLLPSIDADIASPAYCKLNTYNLIRRKRRAFIITETELKVIAALAIIGLKSSPKTGYKTPAAIGTPTTL